jgi:hypothetical protein
VVILKIIWRSREETQNQRMVINIEVNWNWNWHTSDGVRLYKIILTRMENGIGGFYFEKKGGLPFY